MSQVVTATSSASVESSPPEMPIFSGVPRRELLDPLGQPRALDAEDLGAAAVQLGALRRHERRARVRRAAAPPSSGDSDEGDAAERPQRREAVVEAGHDPAVGPQPGDVDVPGDRVRVAADRLAVADPGRLGQQAPFSAIRQWPPKTTSVVDSDGPQPAIAYAATHRPDWPTTRSVRYRLLPIVSLLAERFSSTVAPAMAWSALGGTGTQRSSQISMPTTEPPGPPSPPCLAPRTADRCRTAPAGRPARSPAGSLPTAGLNHRLS